MKLFKVLCIVWIIAMLTCIYVLLHPERKPQYQNTDINQDGKVDATDLHLLLRDWTDK